jgi:thiamine pyrophosphate-dependent acetolactate synthase large subunit-like protein
MEMTEPEIDFVKMAESMGVAARRVTRESELRSALDWALSESAKQSKPYLLDVRVSSELRSMLR